MLRSLAPLAISFAASLALTPVIRILSVRCGLVDHPDGRRKIHGRQIPLAGGPSVLVSVVLAFVVFSLSQTVPVDQDEGMKLSGLHVAGLVIFVTGVA